MRLHFAAALLTSDCNGCAVPQEGKGVTCFMALALGYVAWLWIRCLYGNSREAMTNFCRSLPISHRDPCRLVLRTSPFEKGKLLTGRRATAARSLSRLR